MNNSSSTTQLLQWNLNGFRTRYEDLKILITELQPVALLLQETHFLPTHTATVKGFTIFRHDCFDPAQLRAKGGVAILLSDHLQATRLPLQTSLQAVAVRTFFTQNLTLCSLYLPPHEPLDIDDLINLISQLPAPFLISTDANSHSRLWDFTRTSSDARGKCFEHLLSTEPLQLLNTGEHTHFSTHGTTSAIDLTLVHDKISSDFLWQVSDTPCGSDHHPILLTYLPSLPPTPITSHWKIDSSKWQLFSDLVRIPANSALDDPDATLLTFISSLETAGNQAFGRTTGNAKKSVPWWTADCHAAIQARNRLYNKVRKFPTLDNIIELKKQNATTRRLLKETRRNSWAEYVSSLSTATSQEVWTRIRRIRGFSNRRISPLTKSGQVFTDPQDIADQLVDHFSEISSTDVIPLQSRLHKQSLDQREPNFLEPTGPTNSYNAPFSIDEFLAVLKNLKNTAPGPDTIPYSFIQHAPSVYHTRLLQFFNSLWESHQFPTAWSQALIVPIPKPAKEKGSPDSYRPISLTNCLCKVFERMVNIRLNWFINNHNLLSKIQCGSRKGSSTLDHLVRVSTYVQHGFVQRWHTIALFFDIIKAYDKTWGILIRKTMHDWGLRGNLPIFITHFLANRQIRVKCGDTLSHASTLDNSIPQGSVLSCTLFLIAINSLIEHLPSEILACLYVDDLALLLQGPDLSLLESKLQAILQSLELWSQKTGFLFSTEKTTTMHFCRKTSCHREPDLQLYGDPIRATNSHRFLGMIFDRKLTWANHITALRANCLQSMSILKTVGHFHWGAQKRVLLRLYRALIRSKIDYGSIVYASASDSLLRSLDVVHNQGLRLCLGAFKSSPVDSLYIDAHEPPLSLRRDHLLLNYFNRIRYQTGHLVHHSLNDISFQDTFSQRPRSSKPVSYRLCALLSVCNLPPPPLSQSLSSSPPWCQKPLKIDLSLHGQVKKSDPPALFTKSYAALLSKYPEHHIFFTDGSKIPKVGVAAAYVYNDDDFKFPLLPFCSIFTAELYALLKCVHHIRATYLTPALICSDSLSSLQAMEAFYPANPIIKEIRNVCQSLSICFSWIPSHVGISGNEKADQSAKSAVLAPSVPLPFTTAADCKTFIRDFIHENWQTRWAACHNSGNKLAQLCPIIPTPIDPSLNRKCEIILTRLRIGHCRLTHSYLMSHDPPPLCHHCNCLLTVSHVLTECNQYAVHRLSWPTTRLAEILGYRAKREKLVIDFLHATTLFNEI